MKKSPRAVAARLVDFRAAVAILQALNAAAG